MAVVDEQKTILLAGMSWHRHPNGEWHATQGDADYVVCPTDDGRWAGYWRRGGAGGRPHRSCPSMEAMADYLVASARHYGRGMGQ